MDNGSEVANHRHSSKSSTWQTPGWLVEASRAVLRSIDLDPASCASANKRIKATQYFSKRDNGLRRPWSIHKGMLLTRVFLNPPGGWHNGVWGDSELRYWWGKTLEEKDQGYFGHMIWVSFSIEALQVSQVDYSHSLNDFPTCMIARRVSFLSPLTGKPVGGNTHSSSITYIPGRLNETKRFNKVFKAYGKIVVPYS